MRELHGIILILLLALLVRLVGIDWALPEIYHIDESTLVRAAYGMRFGNLNPGFFDWPSLYKYLLYLLFAAFIKLRVPFQVYLGVETMRQALPFWWGSVAPFYLLARLLTMVFDLGSVLLTFAIGKKFFSRRIGLVAALLMALNAAAVHGVHYDRLEIPTTFFILVSFWFAVAIREKGKWRDYLWAGLFAGLAASTKYNGGLIVVAIAAAHFSRVGFVSSVSFVRKVSADWWGPVLAAFAAVTGFLLGTPYALLDWSTFWSRTPEKGFLWQFEHLGRDLNWWTYIYGPLRQDWGVLLLFLLFAGVVWALWKHQKEDILLLSFPLLYFFLVGRLGIVRGHYLLPLYPFLLILLARFFGGVLVRKLGLIAASVVLSLALVVPVSLIVEEDVSGVRGDTRNLAKDWVLKNIPPQSRISIDGASWPSHLGGILPVLPRIEDDPEGYKIFPFEENVRKYGRNWEYLASLFRREDIHYYISSDLAHGRLSDLSFYDYLETESTLLKSFVPHWYTGPTIKIYQLQ